MWNLSPEIARFRVEPQNQSHNGCERADKGKLCYFLGRRNGCADGKKPFAFQKKHPSYEDGYLDIDLLCAKLEAAKREREEREAASRLRRQVRNAARNDSNASRENERPQLQKKTSTNDGSSKRTSWYKLPATFRKSQPAISLNIPEHETEHFDFISPVLDNGVLDQEDREIVLLSRGSTPEENSDWKRQQLKAKRSSFTILKHFTSNDREQLRRIGDTAHERPGSGNRSHTVPFFKSKYSSSRPNLPVFNTNECKDSCRPSDVDDSFGGLVNEYTISFDTCHVKENIRNQPIQPERPTAAPIQRTKLGSNEGMRSKLSLSFLRKEKKDKSQCHVEEIPAPLYEDEEETYFRRPHTRSQTAPEELICDAATRLKEEKARKRRTVGNMLSSFLVPNHSMSMHQVAI